MTSELAFHRGDVVVCVVPGDYGKPRPAVIVQSDYFNAAHETIALCPVSSHLTGLGVFRVPLPASVATGLQKDSEVMVDTLLASRRSRIRQRIGHLSSLQMDLVDAALRTWLDLPEFFS